MEDCIRETIGVDLGDRHSAYCVLDQATGEVVERGRLATTPRALSEWFSGRRGARVVMETGTHSPWVSREVSRHAAQTLVANARRLGVIFQNARKSDRLDAELLARVGRMDPALLSPIRHRGAQAQEDLTVVRARSALVSARTKMVNTLRGLVKSSGGRLRKQSAASVGTGLRSELPESLVPALSPLLEAVEALSEEIRTYDRCVDELAEHRYPETRALAQVSGVGNLTALAFVLTLESPWHFAKSRDVGAFLGLVPKRDQSGETDKALRITKGGDGMLRALLVQCAHYILGRLGPQCDLKRYGERIAARGGKVAKRKAVVAVARKLAVLLHALWRSNATYQPTRAIAPQVERTT